VPGTLEVGLFIRVSSFRRVVLPVLGNPISWILLIRLFSINYYSFLIPDLLTLLTMNSLITLILLMSYYLYDLSRSDTNSIIICLTYCRIRCLLRYFSFTISSLLMMTENSTRSSIKRLKTYFWKLPEISNTSTRYRNIVGMSLCLVKTLFSTIYWLLRGSYSGRSY
jgi:hypothetical protein